MRITAFVEQLHVEVPYCRVKIFVLFRTEEFDYAFRTLQLEKKIISIGVFRYGEDWKVLFKHY